MIESSNSSRRENLIDSAGVLKVVIASEGGSQFCYCFGRAL